MRIREPRERWILGLGLWGVLFGGVPLAVLVSGAAGGGPGSGPGPVIALFPVVAAAVVGTGVRRWRRSGFTVTGGGLVGAHDAERDVVPWTVVDRLEWRHAGPTSSVRVNDRPLPSGPALFAVLTDGRALRVMQACAPRSSQRERIHRQLDEAYRQGIVPVHLDRRVRPDDGPSDPPADPMQAPESTVTTWSSTGRGTPVPDAGTGPTGPASALRRWVERAHRPVAGDGDPDDDGPVWPTG